jgi:hypothetical protein
MEPYMKYPCAIPIKFYWAREDQLKKDNERAWTGGPCNYMLDDPDRYVIFLDYDFAKFDKTREAIVNLQGKWHLGNCHIYASVETSFHGICYSDWVGYERMLEILKSDPYQDPGYITITERQHHCVLRTCEKPGKPVPRFVTVIESPYQKEKTPEEYRRGEKFRLSVEALLAMPMVWVKDYPDDTLQKAFLDMRPEDAEKKQ